MDETALSSDEKALRLNLDAAVYGTFAEIGAGQEVARRFFHVGGAAGTVAKTLSAYDKAVSDSMYGRAQRYVSRGRLEAMLDHEWRELLEQLGPSRGSRSRFFVFADTVAMRGYKQRDPGNGWLGIRFQAAPHAEPSEILIHVFTRDAERAREQDALGVLGVNLIHGAFVHHAAPEMLLASLLDHLTRERVEIDMIRFSGPAFAGVDNRLMSLRLVEKGLTDAALFTADGSVVQVSEVLYKRPILVVRGRFRPVTRLDTDLLERSLADFVKEADLEGAEPVVLLEMTLRGLETDSGSGNGIGGGIGIGSAGINPRDFLARADALKSLGRTVLVSNHRAYYQLAEHLARTTDKPIGIGLGLNALRGVISESGFDDLPGRTLEAIGRLFARNVRVYLYPYHDPVSGERLTAESLPVQPRSAHLYAHLLQNRHVVPVSSASPDCVSIDADEVLRQIRSSDPAWERHVPPGVVATIKGERLFGWKA